MAVLVAFFGMLGSIGEDLPFAPFDWLQQRTTSQINQKAYDGDGVVIEINDETFARLGRDDWTRSDLARILNALDQAKPKQVLIDRQFFTSTDRSGEDELRAAIALHAEVFWQIQLAPEDMTKLVDIADAPIQDRYGEGLVRIDPSAQGLATPTAMAFSVPPLSAPMWVWYAADIDRAIIPSAAQALSTGVQPNSNRFDVDLSYDPASIPTLNAAQLLTDDPDIADLRDKRIVVAAVSNLARDTIRTPGEPYTSRAAATLMAAQTLNNGPPLRIGWAPAFIIGIFGAVAWVFLRRPWGRLTALAAFFLPLLSTVFLEQHLIFQSTSQGLIMLVFMAVGKVWMRGREAVRTYRSAAETKSRFLAQASHDLRQPIHAIGLLSERLLQTDLSSDQSELVSKISWSVDNASRMFRALLDVAAIESGTLQKEVSPVSINELLAEVDSQNALVAEQAGVDLRLVPSDLVVQTDRALIGTMLQNLVSNAIKYSPGKKVVVGCRRNGKRVSIYVIDSGRGISSSEIKHVEKEFYRSSSKSRLGTENKGLGLAIVNRLTALLGLEFVLNSEEGKGTVAGIHGLPRVTGRSLARQERQTKKLPLSGLRVALAEDDEEALQSTEKLLEQWGCEVTSFSRFPKPDLDCDILLSDFDFGDGGTLAKQADAIEQISASGTRLIIISGHHPDTIRDSLPGLTDLILSKPLRAAELRSALMSARVQ